MADQRLILASASPRRRELLVAVVPGFDSAVCPLDEPSCKPADVSPVAWAVALAYFKARAVAEQNTRRWVLGADTIVACARELLGKPTDLADARRMLELQAGRPSKVITGVGLVRVGPGVRRMLRAAATRVWMRDDPAAIAAYLQSGEWRGKAGAYGIQDVGDRLIQRIEGSFSNVVGLPVELVARMLRSVPELGQQASNGHGGPGWA